jgi:hypothetical protein
MQFLEEMKQQVCTGTARGCCNHMLSKYQTAVYRENSVDAISLKTESQSKFNM